MMNAKESNIFSRISSFSVILIVLVLVVIGAGIMPLLNVQYTPSGEQQGVSVNYSWNNASARVIEAEVTSKIEGLLMSIQGVAHVNSVTYQGGGRVDVLFKKHVNVDAIRFEIASQMRHLYPKLPEGVSYPALSAASSGEQISPILTYTLNAGIPTQQIQRYAEEHIVKQLALIKGVSKVELSGATPYYMEISFDPDKLTSYGIELYEFISAIQTGVTRQNVVGNVTELDHDSVSQQITVLLGNGSEQVDFETIPVKNVNGRIILLRDVATVVYKEQPPAFYFRINGLNTINLTVTPDKYVNTIKLADQVKERMHELEKTFPQSFSATLAHDSSEYVKNELHKIVLRTVLSVLILLLFVYIVSRKLRYLFIITVTLAANIFIACIFYYLLNLEIHLYSLAGITVSLGIIIDTSIIMVDHYGYYRNRKAFLAILAAVLTTIGSLAVVFFLPEHQKANLVEFSAVIIVNLAISIFIALIFVPALMDKFPLRQKVKKLSRRKARWLLVFNRFYGRYILFGKRYKWVYILLIILGFGLPVHMMPTQIEVKKGEEPTKGVELYNNTIGTKWYQDNMKSVVEKIFGGSLRLFMTRTSGSEYYRNPVRPTLTIAAAMPEGCTVQQLNEVMKMMENTLSQFDEIEMFQTRIYGYNSGHIEVTFKKEFEHGGFPSHLKQIVIGKAANYGGATWNVYGINTANFNNATSSEYKEQRILLNGYNYDQLYRYAQEVVKNLEKNKRVEEPAIYGRVEWNNELSRNEFYVDLHADEMALQQVDIYRLYNKLQLQLYQQQITTYFDGEATVPVSLVSSKRDRFDVWHMNHEYQMIGDKAIRFSELGEVAKRRTGNDIYKRDQQYSLYVAYNFLGAGELAARVIWEEVDRLNEEVLPVGFKASVERYYMSWGSGRDRSYLLILLVIAIIYFFCAILFESLREPLIILSLIPISFIGAFLIFAWTGFPFDQGGFAGFVLLCGTVVNAGIYIINQYNITCKEERGPSLRNYIKSYNHKIIPIMLTILSSVLGLIPFLLEGPSEVFWFAFAVCTMGGTVCSIVALIFFLPLFVPMGIKSRKREKVLPKNEMPEQIGISKNA